MAIFGHPGMRDERKCRMHPTI